MATNAIRFNSDNDYLRKYTNLLDYNSPYTCMFWVYIIDNPSTNTYAHFWSVTYDLSADTASSYSYSDFTGYGTSGNRNLRCASVNANTAQYPENTSLSTLTWYNIAAVRSSNTNLSIYLNASGSPDITDITSSTGRPSVGSEILGRLNTAFGLRGRIGCIKQWTTALTPTEIAAEMPYSNAVKLDSLHEIWNFVPGANRFVGDINGSTWESVGSYADEAGPPVTTYSATTSSQVGGTSKLLVRSNKIVFRNNTKLIF